MAGKSKGPKLQHECCSHTASVTGFNPGADGTPQWIAQASVCCHCGQTRVAYLGIVEQGHGPFVSYQPAPEVAPGVVPVRSKLVLPGGRG